MRLPLSTSARNLRKFVGYPTDGSYDVWAAAAKPNLKLARAVLFSELTHEKLPSRSFSTYREKPP